ncbi:glycosyltransferase [Rhodococcus kyotonensis]|nr:glycosyltransferase [Rhodococcus kyotonensis]NIL74480.1 4,4'-diaponeurosporenoate glycosyltransferase [Rhodococcus sp. B10]
MISARPVVLAGAALACASAVMSVANAASMPRLRPPRDGSTPESVVVCVPARDEERDLPLLIADLRSQHYGGRLTVMILDDGSSDDTAAAAHAATEGDPRFHVVSESVPPPDGWTGKAAACRRLADLAAAFDPDVLVFLDADVRLGSGAIEAAVDARRLLGVALLCPWPEQLAATVAERLVQPLLSFSWMSTLPVRVADRSLRPSTVVACGQMMVFDAAAYRDVGGHESVASSATEDLDIARVLRRGGRRTAVASGAGYVCCRMYDGWDDLRDGYTRWLWSAFGGRTGTASISAAMTLAYLVPPVAAVFGSGTVRRAGLLGYAAAVVARVAAARSESGPGRLTGQVAAASAHPVSVGLYLWLGVQSHRRRGRGALTWKSRPLVTPPGSDPSR